MNIFSPFEARRLCLPNRIAMAPMTRSRATDDGVPTALMAQYYAQRADAGLIISEGVNISAQGQGFLNTPGIFMPPQVAGWRPVAEAVRARGSSFFLQLWHVGRIAHPDNMSAGLVPVAPSAVAHTRTVITPIGPQTVPVPRALAAAEVLQTIDDYAAAARRAVEAGCDGVEIHAANGYLPSQFLHASSNQRTDGWGGSIAGRIRFLVEVTEACAGAIGADRVAVRLTPFTAFNGATSPDEPELYAALLAALARLPLAFLDVVRAEVAGNESVRPQDGQTLPDVLAFVRPRWPHTLVATGGYDLATAQQTLARGEADVVAFGRDFIANPDLVDRLRYGHPLAPRIPADWYGSGAGGYTDYCRWNEAIASAATKQPS